MFKSTVTRDTGPSEDDLQNLFHVRGHFDGHSDFMTDLAHMDQSVKMIYGTFSYVTRQVGTSAVHCVALYCCTVQYNTTGYRAVQCTAIKTEALQSGDGCLAGHTTTAAYNQLLCLFVFLSSSNV